MQIDIYPNTKIFIICPGNYTSGGPELLHQLCDAMNSFNLNAFVNYHDIKNSTEANIPNIYRNYKVKVSNVEDSQNNILIVPEGSPQFFLKYKNIRLVFWWLSVDNYYGVMEHITKSYFHRVNYFKRFLIKFNFIKSLPQKISLKVFNENTFHLVQSVYAQEHLKKMNINSIYLSDYINDKYLSNNRFVKKINFILYNPAKGYDIIKNYFVDEVKGIWIPINKMSTDNIIRLMSISKVYIDFGSHPGKDRLPREAAASGCIVLTNKSGSAKYFDDVGIYDKYKIDDTFDFKFVISLINECLDNYEVLSRDFIDYYNSISSQKKLFHDHISKIFVKKNV